MELELELELELEQKYSISYLALSPLWIVVNLRTRRYMDLTTNNNYWLLVLCGIG